MDSTGVTSASAGPAHHSRCAALLRRRAPHQGWSTDELVHAIVSHCGHSHLRAHRLARGWTLAHLVTEMVAVTGVGQRLVASRVSRWERHEEQPSSLYRDALCRVYRTGPVDLGLGTDYGSSELSGAPADHAVSQPRAYRLAPSPLAIVPAGDGARLDPVMQQADALRRMMDETLSASTLSDTTVAYKESVAAQYGRTYKTQPSATFLRDVLADLEDVQVITDRKLPSSQRRDLCAVTARLAGLVSMTMVNLGRYRQAREWVHTARLAADESGEAELRAWVATRGAVASLHLGDPQAAAAAARHAEILTRHQSGNIGAMAWAILARATAAMGETDVARSALRHAEAVFTVAGFDGDNSAFVFTAGQFHFYTSHTLTTIGETRAAWDAQDEALAAFGADERLDPTLVRLDRALCMVADGDISQGVSYASDILLQLPSEYRPTIVLRRARAVAARVPAARRSTAAVQALHEVLAIESATPGTPQE